MELLSVKLLAEYPKLWGIWVGRLVITVLVWMYPLPKVYRMQALLESSPVYNGEIVHGVGNILCYYSPTKLDNFRCTIGAHRNELSSSTNRESILELLTSFAEIVHQYSYTVAKIYKKSPCLTLGEKFNFLLIRPSNFLILARALS